MWYEWSVAGAFWAACFFAIYEGHTEAVMWAAAASDLLVFLFGMAAWICWMKWLQEGGWHWYAAAVAAFVLALGSKESAWVFPLLMLIPTLTNRRNIGRALVGILPFLVLTAAYVGWTYLSRVAAAGYDDNRFSLSSPWTLVVLKSFWRLVFIWGLIAGAVLLWLGGPDGRRKVWIASLWMVFAILPYSFLSYMTQIPSRHTYLASAGLSFLVGAAAVRLRESRRHALFVILCVIVLVSNLEIIWVKKMAQFRERAEPSELLKQAATQASGPVLIECSQLDALLARFVLQEAGSQAVFSPQVRQDDHCFDVQYRTADGRLVQVHRRIATKKHGTFY